MAPPWRLRNREQSCPWEFSCVTCRGLPRLDHSGEKRGVYAWANVMFNVLSSLLSKPWWNSDQHFGRDTVSGQIGQRTIQLNVQGFSYFTTRKITSKQSFLSQNFWDGNVRQEEMVNRSGKMEWKTKDSWDMANESLFFSTSTTLPGNSRARARARARVCVCVCVTLKHYFTFNFLQCWIFNGS